MGPRYSNGAALKDMVGSWPRTDFPNLTERDHVVTSTKTVAYNCIAWAAEYTTAWWWPDPHYIYFWPPGVARVVTLEAFIAAYRTMRYRPCESPDFEEGFQRIALYASERGVPTHAARQLFNGHWTSKLGNFEDIEHKTLDCLNGDLYGRPAVFLRRQV
jgi:hypothetical protein